MQPRQTTLISNTVAIHCGDFGDESGDQQVVDLTLSMSFGHFGSWLRPSPPKQFVEIVREQW